jgi:uncharacterized protein with GYD domain
MAMYILMAKYSGAALKAIIEKGSDREAAARQTVEAAGASCMGTMECSGRNTEQ